MPHDPDSSLRRVAEVFTRAYEGCPPHVRCLPSRQQSPEIMRLVAIACTQVPLSEIDNDNERRLERRSWRRRGSLLITRSGLHDDRRRKLLHVGLDGPRSRRTAARTSDIEEIAGSTQLGRGLHRTVTGVMLLG